MGIYDRDWHQEERRQQREQERRKRQSTAQSTKIDDIDVTKTVMWASLVLNIILGVALLYIVR